MTVDRAGGGDIASTLSRDGVDVFVPDAVALDAALVRTTDLGVGAHPDDLELIALVPIGECRRGDDRWFTGVTCTDGAGSVQADRATALTPPDLATVRREEQRRAAAIGEYGAMLQLGHPSRDIRSADGLDRLVAELFSILQACQPSNVYTHNLADKHETHVAVAAATTHALRSLPPEQRPWRFVGVEAWRDLDWLPDGEKLRFDATDHVALADALVGVFDTQIGPGAKRYDLASQGRRRANATMFEIRATDQADEVVVAMDLTPLVRNDHLDPVAFVLGAIDRFRAEVEDALRPYFA
jgi:LmbE family N-acetylglucosaminyl deacetylase